MSEELLNNPEATAEEPAMEPAMEAAAPVEETKAAPAEAEEAPAAPKKMREIENAYGSLDNFNWDAIEKKGTKYSKEETEQLQEKYTQTFKSIDEQAVIMGTVVSFNSREVVVNIGFKSDGVISASELRYNPDLKIGDEIEVYVESQEDSSGQLLLSHKKARLAPC